MKRTGYMSVLVMACLTAKAAEPEYVAPVMCEVTVCNKLERFSLSIWSHVKDSLGETCFETALPKELAVAGKELSSESRWWQGSSINPTKASVTQSKKCRPMFSTSDGEVTIVQLLG